MNGFDRRATFAVPVLGSRAGSSTYGDGAGAGNGNNGAAAVRPSETIRQLDRLRANLLAKQHVLEVDLDHLIAFNEELANRIRETPGEIMPLFETALRRSAKQILTPLGSRANGFTEYDAAEADRDEDRDRPAAQTREERNAEKEGPDVQVVLKSGARALQFRDLHASYISKLVRLPGIVISASVLTSRASKLHITCKSCRHVQTLTVQGGFSGFTLPRRCMGDSIPGEPKDCPLDPYVIVHEKCTFVDEQVIKLQEAPDAVPVGELPRHVKLTADRYLTGKVIPGSRIIATGVYSTFQQGGSGSRSKGGAIALRTPYLRVLGLEVDNDKTGSKRSFAPEEEDEFAAMARSNGFYERFAESIAPSIYGNLDIKKAVVCLLFGGSKKILPDGMRLRGDINVLLLGDPGTAKSQLLKFVEKVSPISVYTSGKGSSAAGLTASVQRDPQSREFFLEGGAMVLADGGVVCIDEFDKMRDEDRVAIHEAMEQQTISIAKAGITTILNSRTSVLAAANPVFGRYDDMKSPGENIDFQTTILSRFDMIFIVKDEHNELRDRTIAKHVMNIHMNRATEQQAVGEIDIDKMKRYITYCKFRCAPRLSPDAAEKLSSHFVALRKQVQQVERDNNERSSIPITVRQLEAIIRISESLAKLTLSTQVHEHHVDEAMRLFVCSTMDAVSAGNIEGMSRGELMEEINKVETDIRKRLPIGWSTSYASLVREFVSQQGYTQQ
ncbi:MAG: minichromosome maintenance protein 5 [Cyphobasidiales sp. Tagirdzhanova-0007]|nr:MAG: minichromosome maintenance protein 5 [Cyphobasidiales sp. Tagirdzhanova-0007]